MDGEFAHVYEEKPVVSLNLSVSSIPQADPSNNAHSDDSIANMNKLDFLTLMVESRVFDISMIR